MFLLLCFLIFRIFFFFTNQSSKIMVKNFLGRFEVFLPSDPGYHSVPVGSCFVSDNTLLKVVKSSSCRGCAFLHERGGQCLRTFAVPGCSPSERSDNYSVIFHEVDFSRR